MTAFTLPAPRLLHRRAALGGLVGGGLMLARRAGRKSMIPFGPFMLTGAFLAVFWGEILAQAYLDQLNL